MKQHDLDAEMQEMGVLRYRTKVSKARVAGKESITGAGQRVLEHSTQVMAKAIKDWKAKARTAPGRKHRVYPLMKELREPLIAMIACKAILDGISVTRSFTGLSNHVGRLVDDEIRARWIRKNHPDVWIRIRNRIRNQPSEKRKAGHIKRKAREQHLAVPMMAIPDRIALGMVLVELFRQHTDIIETETRTNERGLSQTIVKATDSFMDWLRKSHEASEVLKPVYMPMVSRPRRWDTVFEGGYFAGTLGGYRPMVKANSTHYLKTLDTRKMPIVFDALNRIQDVSWKINGRIADVVRHCWEENLCIGDIPDRNGIPLPPAPEDIATNKESRRQWRKAASWTHHQNAANRTRLYSVIRSLKLAEKFMDQRIWFPHELDFRGRVYPKPIYLHNQGADWQRAMLTFAEGKPVDSNAYSWLAVHGANCAGHDKLPFDQRLKWVTDNHAWIVKCGQDPLAHMDWAQMDKPFMFLAFAMEWAALAADRKHKCALPCHLDGSNNGLQLFSLLMRDEVGALATNCLPTDHPNDIYQLVADKATEKLMAIDSPEARFWLTFGLNRKTTKRVVMCLPYGLSRFSARAYIRDWYIEECQRRGTRYDRDIFRPVFVLTGVVWDSITEVVSSATSCMDWLKQCSDIHVENDMPIRWSTPSGFLVEQAYRKLEKVTVKTSIGNVIRQHQIVTDRPEMSRTRNRNAISPNFVHSLDASLLMSVVLTLANNGVDSVSCIHDSIGVCPADVGILSTAIRECAVEMFSQPILEQVHKEMISYLPSGIDLPTPPAGGRMDISQLGNADYFFA